MKKVGLLEAISIGIGGMVGGGIFAVLGLAVTQAGSATPLAFLIAGMIAIITAYTYSKLASSILKRGGTSEYLNEAFGKNVFTGAVNNFLWVSYIVMLSLYASAFGSYAPNLISIFSDPKFDYHFFVNLIIVIAILINYLSVKMISEVEKWAVIFKLVILFLFVAVGIYGLFHSSYVSQLAFSEYPNTLSIISGGMLIFVAYEGFELISSVTPDMSGSKNIKLSFLISTIFVVILYLIIAIITVGSLPFSTISTAQDYVLAEAAKPVLGQFGFVMIVIAAVISTFSAINATLYSSSRINYELAEDDEIPHEFTVLIKNEPIGVIITAVFALLLVNFVPLTSISGMGSIGFLFIFSLINVSAFKLRKRIGGKSWIYICGFVLTISSTIVLIFQQLRDEPLTVLYTFVLILLCFILEYIYKKSEYQIKHKLIKKTVKSKRI